MYGKRSCVTMSFTDEVMQMAISWATCELGYRALRPNQELVVRRILPGSDAFGSLPTCSGKSLCYCLLSMAFDFLRQQNHVKRIHSDCSQFADIAKAGPGLGNDRV